LYSHNAWFVVQSYDLQSWVPFQWVNYMVSSPFNELIIWYNDMLTQSFHCFMWYCVIELFGFWYRSKLQYYMDNHATGSADNKDSGVRDYKVFLELFVPTTGASRQQEIWKHNVRNWDENLTYSSTTGTSLSLPSKYWLSSMMFV
jgi:hypothetical protein